MTEPTDAELDMVLCHQWPAFSMQATLVRVWVRAAMRDALAKWGTPPAVAGEPVGKRVEFDRIDVIWFNGSPPVGALLYTTPQPTQAQAGAVPLNHKNIEPVRRFLADRGLYLSDETTKALIVVSHGIKGGQHGADT